MSLEDLRSQLADEGRQLMARMASETPDLHLDELADWSDRVLDWATFADKRAPSPGVALRQVDAQMEERTRAYVEATVAALDGTSPSAERGNPGRAFISYVREDSPTVDRLVDELKVYGVRVWLDRNNIQPGEDWREAIRLAIAKGSYFLWCSSEASTSKARSYAHEELTLAIDELRMRATDQAWFIPVRLTGASLPDRDVGGGRRLSDLQWVDLAADWYGGVRKVVQLVAPLPAKQQTLASLLESASRKERARAAERISEDPDPRLVIPLCELIRRSGQSDTDAVYWAGVALARIGDPHAVPVLIEALVRGIGYEYKLVENLERFDTAEAEEFVGQYHVFDRDSHWERMRWMMSEADKRGIARD